MLQFNQEERPSARKILRILLDHECDEQLAVPEIAKRGDNADHESTTHNAGICHLYKDMSILL